MIVMKFGGTSVGSAERIANAANIVKSRYAKNPIVVVSAVGGVTDSLINMANYAIAGKTHTKILNEIITRHYHIIAELKLDPSIILTEVAQLKKHIDGIAARRTYT